MERIPVYEPSDDQNGTLFPIHQACLDIVDRLCQYRQEQAPSPDANSPKTLQDFCDGLESRRTANVNDTKRILKNRYYANSGGIEWEHGYYGARQWWTDEWDTFPGWEFLCADPGADQIPGLTLYVLSELPPTDQGNYGGSSAGDALTGLGWLFPHEVAAIKESGIEDTDWARGVQVLQQKASRVIADDGGSRKRASCLLRFHWV